MITIEDCQAFCDADPARVRELACRECLTMVQAYARAHGTKERSETPRLMPLPAKPQTRPGGAR